MCLKTSPATATTTLCNKFASGCKQILGITTQLHQPHKQTAKGTKESAYFLAFKPVRKGHVKCMKSQMKVMLRRDQRSYPALEEGETEKLEQHLYVYE